MSARNCPFNQEKLAAYASGNLDAQDRVVVERHLAQCADCRKEVRKLEQLWWTLDIWALDVDEAKPRLNDLKQRIQDSKNKKSAWLNFQESLLAWRQFFRPAPTFAMATVVCSLILMPWAVSLISNPTEAGHPASIQAVTDTSPASSDMIASAEPTPLPQEEPAVEDNEPGTYKERMFDAAIQQSRMAQNQYPSGAEASYGFVPSANAYSAYYNSLSTQPSVITDPMPR